MASTSHQAVDNEDPYTKVFPQASYVTKPTVEEIKSWDEDELLRHIQEKAPKLLKGDKLEKFKNAYIDGVLFLKHAGDKNYYREDHDLPRGTSERLADLASEIAGMAQKGKEQEINTGKSTHHAPLLFSLH